MIVQRLGAEVRLIRQPDHATQSAELAAVWGRLPFLPLSEPAVQAVALHDAGWQEWDAAPEVDPTTGLPFRFYEMPVAAHLAIFRRGVERAAEAGDLPGLLVSLHAEGLYHGRFGLVPGATGRPVSAEDEPLVVQFLGEQARLRERLRARLGITAIDPELWRHYRLLQAVDALSLFSLQPSPQQRRLPPVPTEDGEREIDLIPLAPGRFLLDPWPLTVAAVETRVPALRLPQCRYTNETIADALARSTAETVTIEFVSAGGENRRVEPAFHREHV